VGLIKGCSHGQEVIRRLNPKTGAELHLSNSWEESQGIMKEGISAVEVSGRPVSDIVIEDRRRSTGGPA